MKLISNWLEEDKDYTVKHTQLLPGQFTLKMLPPFLLIRDFGKQYTRRKISKISVTHTCY